MGRLEPVAHHADGSVHDPAQHPCPAQGCDLTYDWDNRADEAIAAIRDGHERVEAALTLADHGGIAVVRARRDRPVGYFAGPAGPLDHPLLWMSRNGGDEGHLVITRTPRPGQHDPVDACAADLAARLAPYRSETHRTPTWTIRFACHS